MKQFATSLIFDETIRNELKEALFVPKGGKKFPFYFLAPSWKISTVIKLLMDCRRKHEVKNCEIRFHTFFSEHTFIMQDYLDYGGAPLQIRDIINGKAVCYSRPSNALVIIPYSEIHWFVETSSLYVIMPKISRGWPEWYNVFGFINKVEIDESGQRNSLVEHLEQRCENINFCLKD